MVSVAEVVRDFDGHVYPDPPLGELCLRMGDIVRVLEAPIEGPWPGEFVDMHPTPGFEARPTHQGWFAGDLVDVKWMAS